MQDRKNYYRILKLTAEAEWLNDPLIVEEVQNLGKNIADGNSLPINYKNSNGIKVIDNNDVVREYDSIESCVKNEQLCRSTISRHIRKQSQSKDGRKFIVL